MTYKQLIRKMPESPHLNFVNLLMIGLNVLLGVALIDVMNIVAAATGILVTVAANLGRIAHSIAYLNTIRHNKWRLKNPDNAAQEPNTDNPEKPNAV